MEKILIIVMTLVVLKSIFLGFDFDFITWIKYGKRYTKWYYNRPKFDPKSLN